MWANVRKSVIEKPCELGCYTYIFLKISSTFATDVIKDTRSMVFHIITSTNAVYAQYVEGQ